MIITDLIIGGMAGVISRTSVAPVELFIMQQQNQYLPNTTIKSVIQKEGIKGLWKGNYVNSIRIFPQMAINYSSYQYFKNNIYNNYITNINILNLLSGTTAGIISMTAIYPLENIRSRLALQTNNDHYKGISDIVKKTKITQLYNGLRMSILGYAPYNALNFTFYEFFKNISKENVTLNPFIKQVLSGGLAGSCAVTVTYPTDLIRRRLQLQGFDKLVPKYNGIIDCICKIYNTEGIRGFYRGLPACYMKIFPSLSIQFYMIELMKNYYNSVIA